MIYPVILCGGCGARLWPLSRTSYPKQFSRLNGVAGLFQQAVARVSCEEVQAPIVLTNSDYRFTVAEQLSDVGVSNPTIMTEPEARNTAPAILAAALHLQDQPDAIMLVMPSDHAMEDPLAFESAVAVGCEAAMKGRMVTFGVKPTRAEAGYGYLEMASEIRDYSPRALPLKRFVEKPDQARPCGRI